MPSTPTTLAERFRTIPTIGFAPDDNADTRVRKRVITLTAVIGASAVIPWTVFYYVLGLPQVAAIPNFYVVATAISLWHFARTKNDRFMRYSQLTFYLVLPPLVHIALGGFANSSAVIIYSSAVPVGAISSADTKRPWLWMAAFVTIVSAMVPLDSTLRQWAPDVPAGVITAFFATNIVTIAIITFLVLYTYVRSRRRLAEELAAERERSESLLLNVLPPQIAQRLKDGEQPIADRFDNVAVIFSDIVDFTPLSESLGADELVEDLNALYAEFDRLAARYGIEKIKTIGDAYMAISGTDGDANVDAVLRMACDMHTLARSETIGSRDSVTLRTGVHVGPLVAGVIGESRFIYDVYGETVNLASRMESHGVPGRIQCTSDVTHAASDAFVFTSRGLIDIKGVGPLETFLVST